MPRPGPAPKPEGQARRRNKPVYDWTEVVDTPFLKGPSLPPKMPNGAAWPSWTRRWWRTLSRMPHCSTWAGSDWEFAFDTAALKAAFATSPTPSLAGEIRNRERVLGTTEDFRRALRIRYVPPIAAAANAADVAHLDDYRGL